MKPGNFVTGISNSGRMLTGCLAIMRYFDLRMAVSRCQRIVSSSSVLFLFCGLTSGSAAHVSNGLYQRFRAALEKRPAAVELAFVKEVNLPNLPPGAGRQSFFCRATDKGFTVQNIHHVNEIDVMGPRTLIGGKYGEVMWTRYNNAQFLFEPRLNSSHLADNPVAGNTAVLKATLDLAMFMGLKELTDGSLSWNDRELVMTSGAGERVTATVSELDGNTLFLELAARSNAAGSIRLIYDPTFAEGKFPVSIIREEAEKAGRSTVLFKISMRSAPKVTVTRTGQWEGPRCAKSPVTQKSFRNEGSRGTLSPPDLPRFGFQGFVYLPRSG